MHPKIVEAVSEAVARGYQIHPDAIELLESVVEKIDVNLVLREALLRKLHAGEIQSVLTGEEVQAMVGPLVVTAEPEQASKPSSSPLRPEEVAEVEVLKDPTEVIAPLEGLEGYRNLFMSRLYKLYNVVKQRPDSRQVRSISSLNRTAGQEAKVAGLILEKKLVRNRVELVLDDETGCLDVSVNGPEALNLSSEFLLDQLVIADIRFGRSGAAVAKTILHPDVPDRTPSYSKKRVYAVLTSDIHIGSRTFLFEAFQRFILWLSGRLGDEEIVSRVRYLVVAGDLVDGVGIYPDQQRDLEEQDVSRQFLKLAQLLEQVPKQITIVLTPGNHDPVRQALPQPAIPRDYAEPLYALDNARILGSPASLRLNGVSILAYHGRSLDDVVATTPGLSYARPAIAMKLLLKARHLAPIYGGRTPIAPEREDHLVIEEVPDIFHAGHVHVLDRDEYRGTLILNSGAWQSQTAFQANMGIEPTPGIVPLVDLSTLTTITRNFTKPSGQEGA